MRSIDVVAIGEPMIEFSQLEHGDRRYIQGFGGDTSNVAVAAARQGARVAYVTRVGADLFGEMLLELWRREGVDTSGVIIDPSAPTGAYCVTRTADGHVFDYLRAGSAASRLQPEDISCDVVRSAKFLHVSGISQAISASACDSVFHAIQVARDSGAQVSYDPNLRLKLWPLARARATILGTLPQCAYFLPNIEEARLLSGLNDASEVIAWAHALGARIVVLKMGTAGVLVSNGTESHHIQRLTVEAVDATGAGDCFDGAFLARLVAGDSLWDAARYANAAAALTTRGYGAIAPIPVPEEVFACLARSGPPPHMG